jgi:tetratricopeptide (TPR) repeat protein
MPSFIRRATCSGIAFGAFLVALTVAIGPAVANRGGGGNSGGSPTNSRDQNTCRAGMVWDNRKHMCVQATRGVLPDEQLTEYASALAGQGRYQEALATLDLLDQPETPRALNYRGYASRKLGRLDEGIGYYLRSITLDPQYAQVREYLGEAYVAKGRLDLAKEQLAIIETLCGTTCEEYVDLQDAITGEGET